MTTKPTCTVAFQTYGMSSLMKTWCHTMGSPQRLNSQPRALVFGIATLNDQPLSRKVLGYTSVAGSTTSYTLRTAARRIFDIRQVPVPQGHGRTAGGIIMPSQGGSFTNHPGLVDFNGSSYFFYHNGALPGGNGFDRSVSVESFTYNSDGSFPVIQMTTDGPFQVGSLDPYSRHEAETMAWSSGVETEVSIEVGINVCWIIDGYYIQVKGVAFDTGATLFSASVASASAGGSIDLRIRGLDGTLIGTCSAGNWWLASVDHGHMCYYWSYWNPGGFVPPLHREWF